MKINNGTVILDIPSKSIEDDTIGTIRYKESRDKKPSKLKAYHCRDRYFRLIRVAARHSLLMTLKVYGTGNTAGHYRHTVSIKKQGKDNMSRSTLMRRWFNGYGY